jgi:hypothetical protein
MMNGLMAYLLMTVGLGSAVGAVLWMLTPFLMP